MEYRLQDNVAILALDDGKANAAGHAFLDFCHEGLDRAEAEQAGAVLLMGREGVFSAGFDLKEFEQGMESGLAMVTKGMALLIRLYGYPLPVVAACTGHGVALGAFLLLACDSRFGARGNYRITLPETRINMEIPPILQALCLAQITPRYLTRCIVQAEVFTPEQAIEPGFLDYVVAPDEVFAAALAHAKALAELPGHYYGVNKRLARETALADMQRELDRFGQAN